MASNARSHPYGGLHKHFVGAANNKLGREKFGYVAFVA